MVGNIFAFIFTESFRLLPVNIQIIPEILKSLFFYLYYTNKVVQVRKIFINFLFLMYILYIIIFHGYSSCQLIYTPYIY